MKILSALVFILLGMVVGTTLSSFAASAPTRLLQVDDAMVVADSLSSPSDSPSQSHYDAAGEALPTLAGGSH